MNIRFTNVKILTMEPGREIFDGELHVKDYRIVYVGPTVQEAVDPVWDREIDGEGNLLMPGFKNAHAHSGMTFLRSYADDLPLHEWLNDRVFPMEAKLTPEMIYHLTKLAILEYLTSGITAAADMYLTPDTIARAAADCGFRMVLVGAVNDFSQSVEEMERCYEVYNHYHPLVSYQLGFHAEYTTGRERLEAIADLAARKKAPVFTHNSETKAEVEGCIERNGMTPTVYLEKLGMFRYGGGGYHCVHMSPEDLDIFAEHSLYAITNPASNLKLASGIAPVEEFLQRGIPVAIGTDGPASNNCLDMFREMFLVTALAKYRENDASAVDAGKVLRMAAVGGAGSMGLSDCDILAAGKQADLILIDLHQPNMQPINHIVKNLVYSGSKSNVALTMIAGKILYERGSFFIGEDPEAIYAKANEITRRLGDAQ